MSNELVTLSLNGEARLRLYGQIAGAMEKKGLNCADWGELDLGFELPAGWPIDNDAQPTLAQLVVIAHKLGMGIEIEDLNMYTKEI